MATPKQSSYIKTEKWNSVILSPPQVDRHHDCDCNDRTVHYAEALR